MIYLYHGGGASISAFLGDVLHPDEWRDLRSATVRLLRARKQAKAAEALNAYPFELLRATNDFGDDFSALRFVANLDQYVNLSELQNSKTIEAPFHVIATTITELGTFVRFVVVELESTAGLAPVQPPAPQFTTEAVDRALADAELLIKSRGPEHAVDRVHTAIHGYLRGALELIGENTSQTDTATELFKRLREVFPQIREQVTGSAETKRLIMALAQILDTLGTLRNNASGAHPNSYILQPPEAMLAINAARSLLHYLDDRLG